MLVYTAIFDGYDSLLEPRINSFNYMCYTNYIVKHHSRWNMINCDFQMDGFRKNRYIKINSHKFAKNDISIYIDPTFYITRDFSNKVEDWLGDNNIAVMLHPKRGRSVYEEAKYLIKRKPHKLDSIDIVKKQMDMFLDDGLPKNTPANQGGLIIRRDTEDVNKFNEKWWDIVKNYSKRDQLSFSYVSWKLDIPYSILPRDEIESYTQRVAWHV